MKVCVTGGAGFVGSVVVRRLIEAGHGVRCMLRKATDIRRIDGLAFERVEGDVRDAASTAAAVAGCEGIVHLASPSSWDDINSPLLDEVVLDGTAHVLEAAGRAGAAVVFCSSAAAINAADAPVVFDEGTEFKLRDKRLRYAHAKQAAEVLCRKAAAAGQRVVIVNPAEIYGPNDHGLITSGTLIDFARSSPVLVTNGGTAIVSVEDVAQGIVRALERGRSGERYILAGPNLTIRQLAEHTLRILGLKRPIVAVPTPIINAVTRAATALHIPLPFNANAIPYGTRYWFVSNKKATEELGVTFRGAEEVLAPALAWLQQAGHIKPKAV
jgi:dihydroflavonol-4-reductase